MPNGCPAFKAAHKAAAAAETAAGRFAPAYAALGTAPKPTAQCFRCWELPDSCLEVLPARRPSKAVYDDPRSNTIGVRLYPKNARPFRLHVAGLSQDKLRELLDRMVPFVKDPLFSEYLRHLENDVLWADRTNASLPWPLFRPGGGVGNARSASIPSSSSSSSASAAASTGGGDDELVMMWPMWEKGYGDVIANTLLPFGELLRRAAPPRHLALSGMRHATLLPPLRAATSSLCAIERDNLPLLPRCESACWRRLRICAPNFFESTIDSWRSTAALDAAAKWLPTNHADVASDPVAAIAAALAADAAIDGGAAAGGGGAATAVSNATAASSAAASAASASSALAAKMPPRTLKVLIASRSGRRLLANDAELTAACDGVEVEGTRLSCALLPAAASQEAKIAALRLVDVYVVAPLPCPPSLGLAFSSSLGPPLLTLSWPLPPRPCLASPLLLLHCSYVAVWGGDTVHSLHMRHGSAVIELRNAGFAVNAPWSWLELHKRWVTRFAGPPAQRPLHFYPVALPANATVVRKAEEECFERNAKKRAKLRLQNRTKVPQDDWLCYWNADLHAPFERLLPALSAHVRWLGGETKAKGERAGKLGGGRRGLKGARGLGSKVKGH